MSLRRNGQMKMNCQIPIASIVSYHYKSLQVQASPINPDRNKRRSSGGETSGVTCPGSLTVEAALSLSLFLMFWTAMLTIFPALQIHQKLRIAMEQAAEEAAVMAYGWKCKEGNFQGGSGDSLAESVGSASYLAVRVIQLADRERLSASCISGGWKGISFWGSGMTDENQVMVRVSYGIRIPFLYGWIIPVSQQVCRRCWTGESFPDGADEARQEYPVVYVAENGQVYHTSSECSYLKLSVRKVDLFRVEDMRNRGGGKYYACEFCGEGASGTVYITDEGSRYHSSRECCGLKRTVTLQSGDGIDLPVCHRCGGS